MTGIITWIVCGVAMGYVMSYLISGSEKGLLLLTLGVGAAGGIAGGFIAQLFGQGTSTTFSFYALLLAVAGAFLSLLTYRRLIGV